MSEIDAEDSTPIVSVDPEIKEILGLFDIPAFARRGLDLEYAVGRIHERCRHTRGELLEMVQLRLRQWTRVATGPDQWATVFGGPIGELWPLSHSEPPVWAAQSAPLSHRQAVARDLVASLRRFNHRWQQFLQALNLEPANQVIDQYNAYYVLEKECVMGSARLASRHFAAVPRLSTALLLGEHPLLPVPELVGRADPDPGVIR
jgi:hypothetical protein